MRLACALAALLAGCYSPDVRDCTLACDTSADCAADQVCGAQKMCASPAVACGSNGEVIDGGIDRDAPAIADAPMRDAPGPMVTITVMVMGMGTITLDETACTMPMCMIDVPMNVSATAVATGSGDQAFMRWTSVTCLTQGATCTFTPATPTTIAAMFMKKN
ncbi:MAG TPA: hypothetical protein VGG74_23410 [Kofleriaceae bacterium]|jgi:hypothetical protein